MQVHQRRLVTIIAEAALERALVAEFEKLGVRGYTISDARGRGDRGRRSSNWEHSGNVRIEIICDAALAQRVMETVHERYSANYAMVQFAHDVDVLRAEKFV